MSETVIKVNNISKMYDLGLVGTGTLSKDLNRAWARFRGKPDPYATLAELNDRTMATKSGSVWALKGINFEVKQGEVLGIIGKNGAGKSTLLKILSQITTPTTGDIKIKGRLASLLEVGTGMHPEMTARQNIYLNGAIMGMTRREVTTKMDEIIDFAGIGKYIDTPFKRFSSGMQVRLGFAVAAFLEPEILIVDEVLAVGDAEFQKKAIGKMQDVSANQGRTVLFVSHNMASVKSLCSKGLLIEKGSIAIEESIDCVIDKYVSVVTSDVSDKYLNENGNNELHFIRSCELLSKIKTGESLKILVIISSPNITIVDFAFTLRLNDGTPILQVFSEHSGEYISLKKGLNKIEIEVSKLLITSGWYKVNLWLGRGGESLDFQDSCMQVFVEEGKLDEKANNVIFRGYHNITSAKWIQINR
jgi:lipopolysaccharide transport system ATP-binding protein